MKISDYDFELPKELIADKPATRREMSRLLLLDKRTGATGHEHFRDIETQLRAGDLLVLNNSRVLRARLRGRRVSSGGAVEALLLEPSGASGGASCDWLALCRPAKKMSVGERLTFGDGRLDAVVAEVRDEGERVLRFDTGDIIPLLDDVGEMPLPPYIVQRRRELGLPLLQPSDNERYQTVYAKVSGSVAAPTAGLHFTPELLDRLRGAGVETAEVTLHVGAGTFKPVETENVEDHKMHAEHYSISAETADAVNSARAAGRRVVVVGTTTARALESAADPVTGKVRAGAASTDIMIAPGYKWRVTDALITNFHLPRSTLLLLVSALASREYILAAYGAAINERYRFFSYGDAMFIR